MRPRGEGRASRWLPRGGVGWIASAALALAGCSRAAPPAAPPPPPPEPQRAYVGSQRCAACHADEARAWARTAHGTHGSFALEVSGGAALAVGSRWMQAYLESTPSGLHSIAPRCYDLGERRWRDVPEVLAEIGGMARDDLEHPLAPSSMRLEGRRFETDCAGCHSSQPSLALGRTFGALLSTRVEMSIGCESCHGPGRAHAEAWARADPSAPLPRLERLPAREATALCARCHGGPPTAGDFGPADAPHYVAELGDRRGQFPDGRAAGQVYQVGTFVRSGCYRDGGLTCADCHDPHGPGRPGGAGGDAGCVRCHAGFDTRAHTHHAPSGPGARCVECHMPRMLTGLVAHQRDHRIGVPLPQVASSPDACTACHQEQDKAWAAQAWSAWWGAPPAATIAAVAAVAEARRGTPQRADLERALEHRDPFFRAEAVSRLARPEAGLADPAPEVRLAAVQACQPGEAGELALQALTRDGEMRVRAAAWQRRAELGLSVPTTAIVDLSAAARHQRGNANARRLLSVLTARAGLRHEAARWLEEAFLARPLDPMLASDAASSWINLGEHERAARVLSAAASAQPNEAARQRLEELLRRLEPRLPRKERGP